MTEYMTEQEQIEQLKAWIKQYGLTIIAGIVIAFVLVTGWRYWQQYQNKILVQASITYDQILDLKTKHTTNDLTQISVKSNELLTKYSKTPYAAYAALMLAHQAVSQNNYAEANKQLSWVIKNSKVSSLREIARLRQARIAIEEKNPQGAISILNTIEDKAFNSVIAEVKGDAFLKMNDKVKATESYLLALQSLPSDEMIERPLLQMKLDNIALS